LGFGGGVGKGAIDLVELEGGRRGGGLRVSAPNFDQPLAKPERSIGRGLALDQGVQEFVAEDGTSSFREASVWSGWVAIQSPSVKAATQPGRAWRRERRAWSGRRAR